MTVIEQFWNEFKAAEGLKDIKYKEAFQFGTEADRLSGLVVEGEKTATCSAYAFYEIDNEAVPEKGDYSIVLTSTDEPVAVIQTELIEIIRMNEVSEDFALSEGEGDYEHWWNAHVTFFTEELKTYDRTFSPDMFLVCERFKKVYPK